MDNQPSFHTMQTEMCESIRKWNLKRDRLGPQRVEPDKRIGNVGLDADKYIMNNS